MAEILADTEHGILVIRTEQFMTSADEANDFIRQILVERQKFGSRPHAVLVDLTKSPLQSKDISDHLASLVHGPLPSGKVAFVVSSAMARMQLKRIVGDDAHVFAGEEEARRWIASSQDSGDPS